MFFGGWDKMASGDLLILMLSKPLVVHYSTIRLLCNSVSIISWVQTIIIFNQKQSFLEFAKKRVNTVKVNLNHTLWSSCNVALCIALIYSGSNA